jgi:hypothetical protein
MAYLVTPADLKTHIHEEQVDEITRDDESITEEAIESAILEAAGFMGKYDAVKLLGSPTVNPTHVDSCLKGKVKDIVRMYLIALGNPNIDYAVAQEKYQSAIDNYFKPLQKGNITPLGWPFRDVKAEPKPVNGSSISHFSNRKRKNHS